MADALVDTRAGVPSRAIVMNQQTEQRLVRYCDSGAIGIGAMRSIRTLQRCLPSPAHRTVPLSHHRRGNSAADMARWSVPDRHLCHGGDARGRHRVRKSR